MNNLEKLNRLRVNAGKNPLKGWKASQAQLEAQIKRFEDDGFTDVVTGADTTVVPKTDDPVIAKVLPKEEEIPSLADSALSKNVANPSKEPERKKQPAKLARGLETEKYAVHSRKAVADHRRDERNANKKKVKLTKADKKQIKDEAKSRIAGAIDPKKDPERAKRQAQHVADKQAARANKPKNHQSPDEVTVAEIARELDIDPKVARAKLRRHEAKLMPLHTKGQERWTFPKSAKKAIVEILK
jgi:hypothetical protein